MGAVPIVDEATFRAAFPEFADTTVYTSVQFALWEAEAERGLRPADRLAAVLRRPFPVLAALTSYGREYLDLLSTVGIGVMQF